MIKQYTLDTKNPNWITISGQDLRGENLNYFEIVPIAKKSIPVFQITTELINDISDYSGLVIGANMSQSYMINIERFGFDGDEKVENAFIYHGEKCEFMSFLNKIFENTAQNIMIGKNAMETGDTIKPFI